MLPICSYYFRVIFQEVGSLYLGTYAVGWGLDLASPVWRVLAAQGLLKGYILNIWAQYI